MAFSNDFLRDKRVVARNISKGLLTREQHRKYIDGLADSEINAQTVVLAEVDEDTDASRDGHDGSPEW